MKESLVIHDLVKEALQKERCLTTSTTGFSMSPLIYPGDEIQVRRCSLEEIKRGDIVLFKTGGRLIIHRVHRIETDANRIPIRFITKGDAVSSFDEPNDAHSILAKITSCGKSNLDRIIWIFRNQKMIFLKIIIPEFYERIRNRKRFAYLRFK